jgi:hypothetical protein
LFVKLLVVCVIFLIHRSLSNAISFIYLIHHWNGFWDYGLWIKNDEKPFALQQVM